MGDGLGAAAALAIVGIAALRSALRDDRPLFGVFGAFAVMGSTIAVLWAVTHV